MNAPPKKLIVAFGAGRNSTALLIGLLKRNIRPDWIMFGDTGSPHSPAELPETLDHLEFMHNWCLQFFGLPITKVRGPITLEQDCLARKALPALAYGWRTCSERFKQRPQHNWIKHQPGVKDFWKAGHKITRMIGIHAGEVKRIKTSPDDRYENSYPLCHWRWDEKRCQQELCNAAIAVPPKSSCFFCPARTTRGIKHLANHHPELYARAIKIESYAINSGQLRGVKGLGRRFAWRSLNTFDPKKINEFDDELPEIPCDCYDG